MRACNIWLVTRVMAVALLLPVGNWGIFGGAEALAQDELPVHYKCYKIVPSGPPVQRIIDLRDQFGLQEDVRVTASELLCAPALKNTEGTVPEGPHLKCYVISRDVAPLRQPATLTDQFGSEEVRIMEPLFLCQEVMKTLPDAR
jgi:hypothetical protein